ncbi:MAG TPA: hypothetical protein V6C97_03455 [Oculatellaceae cyanobacterium]
MTFIICMLIVLAATGAAIIFAPISKRLSGAIGAGLALLVLVACSVTTAQTGTIKLVYMFGQLQSYYIPDNGMQLVNPLISLTDMNIQRREIDPNDGQHSDGVRTGTSDDNFLTVSAIMPYAVNPALANKLYGRIPDFDTVMMLNSANAALRKGVAEHAWTDVVKDSSGAAAQSIQTAWQNIVHDQLVSAGFTKEEANNVFTFFPVQIKKALPDDKVLQATANRSAEVENLSMQETLTKQQTEVAKRRTQEGDGLANLIKAVMGKKDSDPMPVLKPSDVSSLLLAIAAQERANAMVKIADGNRPLTIIMNGDSGGPAAVPSGTYTTDTPASAPPAGK